MNFADRLAEASRQKDSVVLLGIDPQLDTPDAPGVPPGHTLAGFCCEIVEACAHSVVAVKPQLAFFEARGLEGMRAFVEVVKTARRLGLITIADAKRGDIGTTSAAYAEAFLGNGDFGCDAVTINPYQGSDAAMPFVAKVREGRGVFVLVKTSNPSSGEFQDLAVHDNAGSKRALWETVAMRVNGWGGDFVGASGLSSVGAVVGATYPDHAHSKVGAQRIGIDSGVRLQGSRHQLVDVPLPLIVQATASDITRLNRGSPPDLPLE